MAANSRFAVATHILTLLGRSPKGSLLSSEWIAGSVNTNPVVVRRVVSELAKAGLVTTHSGKHGGVELARAADRLTLLDVYEAVGESEVFALNGAEPNPLCSVSRSMGEVLTPVFADIRESLKARLKRTKLSDLVGKIGA